MVTKTSPHIEARSDTIRQLTRRVQAEYSEMPGLSVTLRQAQRLLGIDPKTCAIVMTTLVTRGFLRRTPQGTFIKA